jgi:hypothetical protein
MLRDWDIQLNRILKAKGRLPYTSSPTALHTSKSHGGLGLFTFGGLAREAIITSLLACLNNPSFVGAASRTRWHHMQELLTLSPSPSPIV